MHRPSREKRWAVAYESMTHTFHAIVCMFLWVLGAASAAGQDAPDAVIIPPETDRNFGTRIVCGKFDGDEWMDIVIGSPQYDEYGQPAGGSVSVVYGNEILEDTLWLGIPGIYRTRITGKETEDLGASLLVTDVNGDGNDDLAIGAPQAMVGGGFQKGAVFVLFGNPGKWGRERDLREDFAEITATGRNEGDQFGGSMAAGDMDGNGTCDLACGAMSFRREDPLSTLAGAVFILSGISAHRDTLHLSAKPDSVFEIWGMVDNDRFGWALSCGDVQSDGYDDLFIGAYKVNTHLRDEGACYLFYGKKDLPPFQQPDVPCTFDEFLGSHFAEHMGYAVLLSDLNRDGLPDLILGSQQAPNGTLGLAGCVRVLWGRQDAYGKVDFMTADPDLDIRGGTAYAQLGVSLCTADLNGDGMEDLIAGAPYPTVSGETKSGEACIFYGRPSWPSLIDLAADSADCRLSGPAIGDLFGSAIASGDVNGDGVDDLVVGAPHACTTGAVYVYFGRPRSEMHRRKEMNPGDFFLSQNYPNPFNSETCIRFSLPESRELADARLEILNIEGRVVRTWPFCSLSPGAHTVLWDGRGEQGFPLPTGMYLIRLSGSGFTFVRKTALMR